MVDPMHKVVRNDPRINWICNPVHVSAHSPSKSPRKTTCPTLCVTNSRTFRHSPSYPIELFPLPQKHREMRGLTAAGRKYRGLQGKGHNYNKARPSKRGTWKRNQQISLKRYR